jgi:hypothetical protein
MDLAINRQKFNRLDRQLNLWISKVPTYDGWIDIGDDGQSSSFVRALNEGDLVWEDNDDDATLDEILEACDTFLADEMSQYGQGVYHASHHRVLLD